MSALIVAGITVPVARTGVVKRAPDRIGSASRAYAGNLRTTYRAEKRNWTIPTQLLTDTDALALEAAVALGVAVTCSGAILGGSISCEIEVQDSIYTPLTNGVFRRTLVLAVREI
jgi:hypothetical protein